MATNQTGIAIIIKAFLPIGKTLAENLAALNLVNDSHISKDYAELLKAAVIDSVKTEQKTRRVEDASAPTQDTSDADTATTEAEPTPGLTEALNEVEPTGPVDEPAGTIGGAEIVGNDEPSDAEVPAFLKTKKAANG